MLQRYLMLSLMMLVVPISALAADPVAPIPTLLPTSNSTLKIGVIDVRTTIQKSPQLNAINNDLAKIFKPRELKIVDAQTSLKADEDKIQKDSATMNDTDRNVLRDKIITERANLQAMITSFQQDLDSAQNSAMQKLLSQIAMIVNDIAKQEKFDLILQGDNVPFVIDRLNITTQVLQQLSKK
jgi:outer membrane protein